jgi:cathepsin L
VVESRYFIKTGQKLILSEQQLVDCVNPAHDGCNGGSIGGGYEYLQTHSQMLSADYPFMMKFGTCKYQPAKGKVRVKDEVQLPRKSIPDLMAAIVQGPVGVSV